MLSNMIAWLFFFIIFFIYFQSGLLMRCFVHLRVITVHEIGASSALPNDWLPECILCALKLCVTRHAGKTSPTIVKPVSQAVVLALKVRIASEVTVFAVVCCVTDVPSDIMVHTLYV